MCEKVKELHVITQRLFTSERLYTNTEVHLNKTDPSPTPDVVFI